MGRKRMKELRISPDFISHLNKDEIFVFGSNLEGEHRGGAAQTAKEKFGARWGEGDGLTGNCYAIPTMHGDVKDIKPYTEKFIKYAQDNPQKKFLLTRIGCGIAGFYDGQMAALFKDALRIPNVYLPRKWVEILLQDKNLFMEVFKELPDDYDFYYLNAVRENDLVRLSHKYKKEISKGDKRHLPKIKIRYIDEGKERFGYADFGDFFMLDNGESYIFTDEKDYDHTEDCILRCLFFDFDFECERKQHIKKVLFAGVETHYTDSYGDKIYTGDVLEMSNRGYTLALGTLGWNSENNVARYAFVLDNHCLFPEDGGKMTRVGTVFYDLPKNKPIDLNAYCSSFQGIYPDGISQEEKIILAKHTPAFKDDVRISNNKYCNDKQTSMYKIGRIKSWYIDPDDPNRRKIMYTTHNYLLVTIVDGHKFYAALHDTCIDTDNAIALEIGDFELNGMKFNARFDDYRGNTNYTNVSLI